MRPATRLIAPLLAASAQAAHFEVTVGRSGQLQFVPEVIKANIGDTIRYTFFAKNHSVVESSFGAPCEPLKDGIFSGFVPTESEDVAAPTDFTVTVHDLKPRWIYCSQGSHCQRGMVHVINPPASGNNLDGYKKAAAEVAESKSPGGGNSPRHGVRRATVEVGKDGAFTFSPSTISEPKGTVVRFSFHPRNHTVTQAPFDSPCQPVEGGFSSGFVPVATSPSGAAFEVEVTHTNPMWFYCGQGTHCQAGMVGVINPPAHSDERTLEAFAAAAKQAPASTIPPDAPLGGVFRANGTIIHDFHGNAMPAGVGPSPSDTPSPTSTATSPTASGPAASHTLPADPADAPRYYADRAGGGKPRDYNWAAGLSAEAAEFLRVVSRLEDVLVHLLWEAAGRLGAGGAWAGAYPGVLVETVGAWAAQALVQRATAAEVLRHYGHAVPAACAYRLPGEGGGAAGFLAALAELNSAAIGALIDVSGRVAAADPFLIPLLATQVGAKSRAAGVVNMMQNHMASVAPREVAVPAPLAWSFAVGRFVESCSDGPVKGMPEKPWPVLSVAGKKEEHGRVVGVDLTHDASSSGEHHVAWMGPYGLLEFTKLVEADGKKSAAVPEGWFGDAWVAVVSKSGVKLNELADHMVAGPAMVWLTDL